MKILYGIFYILMAISLALSCDFIFNSIYDLSPNITKVFNLDKSNINLVTIPIRIYLGWNIGDYFINKYKQL